MHVSALMELVLSCRATYTALGVHGGPRVLVFLPQVSARDEGHQVATGVHNGQLAGPCQRR